MPEAGGLRPLRAHNRAALRPAADLKSRRTKLPAIASLALLASALLGRCDGLSEFLDPYQLPVRGLSIAPAAADSAGSGGSLENADQVTTAETAPGFSNEVANTPHLIWTLNVGVLNDSEHPELVVADLQPLLEESSQRLKSLLPGVEVRFIIDQPMNSVFLIERSVRKKGFLGPKYDAEGTVLLLGSGAADAERNQERLERVGVLSAVAAERELALLERLVEGGCLSEKLPASEYVWRAYMAGQVRYDLIVTNALVYADDLESRLRPPGHAILTWEPGSPLVRGAIVPTNGRSALEGYGALVSVHGRPGVGTSAVRASGTDGDTRTAISGACPDGARARTTLSDVDFLTATIFQLLRPADFSSRSPQAWRSPAAYLAACGEACAASWRRRRAYLATMVSLESGGGASACERLEAQYAPYAQSGVAGEAQPDGPVLNPERAGQYKRNHTKFLRLCGKKR